MASNTSDGLKRSPDVGTILVVSVVFFALLVGISTALLPQIAVAAVLGIFGVFLVLYLSLSTLLLSGLILTTVIAGSAEYFAGLSQANWLPYFLALALGFRGLVEINFGKSIKSGSRNTKAKYGMPIFLIPALLYLAAMVTSTIIAQPPFIQLFVGAKNYIFMAGVLIAYIAAKNFDATIKSTWQVLILVGCIQLPVVLYQKFFIASQLSNAGGRSGLSWDAISGTFGGGLLGGHSGAMALFASFVITICLIAWRNGNLSLLRLILISVAVLVPIFLGEVKAVVVWLTIAGSLVFIRQIRTRPLVFLIGMLSTAAVVGAIIFAYNYMYYEGTRSIDLAELYEKQIKYFFDINKFNSETRQMGRIGSLAFWWRENEFADITYAIFGHGLGASRGSSTLAIGEVARKYTFFIDTSSATTLLWDLGVFGLAAFVSTLGIAAWEAHRLSLRSELGPTQKDAAEAVSIGLCLILTTIIYNRDSTDNASVQFLMFSLLAIVYRLKISIPKATLA